jgi:tetratricopeptide (TPR) repeat protein/class 3 adenylate cyclase
MMPDTSHTPPERSPDAPVVNEPGDAALFWRSAGDALAVALGLPETERRRWIERVGAKDPALRREVESLLAAHARSGLLDAPVRDLAPAGPASAAPGAHDAVIGHYRILALAGAGGMGLVYKARDLRLERTVVLKLLPSYLMQDARARERFRVEAQAAAALDHPNICTIYEVGEGAQGEYFIAMAWYDGDTLARRLARGVLPVEEAVALALQLARGLARAHEYGIIHRDIKPANLVITTDGVLKILDFGVAKLRDLKLSEPGVVPGTLAYMSPEQANAEEVDARADLWSLGVVLHEMLAGALPFRGDDARSMLLAIRDTEPESLLAVRSDVPPALNRLVRTLLAKRPEGRPASAADVAAELEAIGAMVGTPALAVTRRAAPEERGGALLSMPDQGERRQATVIALRISGHANLIEARGAAYTERAVERVRTLLESATERYRGQVNRFDENGAIIVFGVPRTHEDDAVRAARAAVEFIAAAVADASDPAAMLQLHVGLDTGNVITRRSVDGRARHGLAGAAMDLAWRLAGLAPPGQIWVSPHCRRLLDGWMDLEPCAPVALPIMPHPVVPWQVVPGSDTGTRFDSAERQGDVTPYTGRDRELALMREALADACRGSGRFVTVVGEAGMGKSRLLLELRRSIGERDVTVLQGRCQSYGGGAPYLPFIDVLRDALELAAMPETAGRAPFVARRVHELAPELDEFVPLFLHLLSIPSDEPHMPPHLRGEQFRFAAQEAIAGLLTASSRSRATVLLLEDWHWVDDASHAVLSQVAELAAHHAMLVVVTCRPGYIPDWGSATPHAVITLGALAEESSRSLLRAILRVHDVPEPLGALLHERTGGNPFFLEEICQTLLEDGTVRVSAGRVEITGSLEARGLPDTVQAVIRARLDRLDPGTSDILRVAAVIGREFARDVLERTIGEASRLPAALQALKAAGVIQQVRILPAAEYRFKHVLMQEVAYASLLEHQRRALHGLVGEAIEALRDPLPDEQLERLASHFSRAERWDRAVDYAVRAADRAAFLAEFPEAFELLARARGWLLRMPENDARRSRLVDLLLRQERLSETLGRREQQQRLIDEMIALLKDERDPARLAEVLVRQGDLFTLLRQFEAAEAALQRSLLLRRELGDALGITNTLRSLGLLRWHQGRDGDALAHIEEALAIDRARGDAAAVIGDLSNLGYVLKGLGMLDRARARLQEGLELSDRTLAGDVSADVRSELAFKHTYLMHNLANVLREIGDNEGALELLNRTKDDAAGKRMPIQLSYHYTSIAHMLLQAGRIDESLAHYRSAVELTRGANFVPGLAQSLSMLGTLLLGLGRDAEARGHLEEAAQLFAQLKDRQAEARLWTDIARVDELAHQDASALACWSRARALHRELRDRAGELVAVEGLARVTRRHVAEPSFGLSYYVEAAALALTLGDTAAEGRLRNIIGILEWESGRHAAALEQYEAALACFRRAENAEGIGLALNSIGVTLRAMGRRDDARRALDDALEHNRREGLDVLLGHALGARGALEMDAGEVDRAAVCFEESLAIRLRLHDRRGEAWMRYELAGVAAARGSPDTGRSLRAAAAALADECGDAALGEACDRLRRSAGL